ncbi:MAG: MATE family efflux transporter [Hyphomonadaceae bacterium]
MTTEAPRQLPLWRTFLVFLLPMMLSNILQSLSGTLNGVFLGQLIDVDAMATASVLFPVMFFCISLVIGVATGATVLIGQAYGARDMALVRRIAGLVLLVVLISGVVIGGLGAVFAPDLLRILGTPENIFADATRYARIIMVSMPVMFLFILATSILRGVGDTVTPLWALIFSTLTGAILTPALILGWAGLPKLGPPSAAIASVVSITVALAWLCWRMNQKKMAVAPNIELFRHMRFDGAMLARVLRIGVPTGVQMVIFALSEIVLLGLANAYGSDVTAAYGATTQVLSYVQFPAMSIGISASILAAQAIGAGKADSLDKIMRTAQLLNLVITGLGVIVVYLLSHTIISLFITEPDVIKMTDRLIAIVLWSLLLFGVSVAFSGIMRGSGTVLAPTGIAIFAILAVEIPVAIVMTRHIGVEGVWWAYPAAFAAMAVMQGAYYYLVWRRQKIERLV